ncbi:MAG: glycosyltransferase family 4 protein [Rhodobacteraceae bacterium]|nr:glycosyltransferase family 4 protein [Paracoccaceae bacterium]
MKILYHHRTLSKDGQNVHIEELIAAFRRAGHEVEVVGPSSHAKSEFGSDGGTLSRLRQALPQWISEILEFAYSLLAFARLYRAAKAFKPDFLYERHNLYLMAGAWLRRLTELPYILEVNAPLYDERAANGQARLGALARWTETSVWKTADIALPVTQVLADIMMSAGTPRERILVVPNGINPAEFANGTPKRDLRSELGVAGSIVIGFTGFVRAWHGLPGVVDAMADLVPEIDCKFLIVGDGPAVSDIKQRAAEKNIADRVFITGIIKREDMSAYVAAFDIAMQPQATPYASPLKLFEYLALGKPVIAPDQPNLREILTHEDNALLFDPHDDASLGVALTRLLRDPDLRARLGTSAKATISRRGLTWDDNARRVVERAGRLVETGTGR